MIQLEFKNHGVLLNVDVHHVNEYEISFFIDDYVYLNGRYEIVYSIEKRTFNFPKQATACGYKQLFSNALIRTFNL